MSHVYGEYGPRLKVLPAMVKAVVDRVYGAIGARRRFYRPDSEYARAAGEEFRARLAAGERLYLMGITPYGHNTGVALVAVSAAGGIEILANNEEERFSGEKHTNKFPVHSIDETRALMKRLEIAPEEIFCVLGAWDYVGVLGFDLRVIFEHAPRSLVLMNPKYDPTFNLGHLLQSLNAPAQLSGRLGMAETKPILGMHHHQNHAYLAHALSPFATLDEPVIVAVFDATGDNGAISLYSVTDGRWECLRENRSTIDSLGYLYGYISSTQGGWTFLSSEGRYMGAAAWGNGDRITNPYYKRLRQLVYLGRDGEFHINRKFANWHIKSHGEPYGAELADILGPPIPRSQMWNPDAVLNVDDVAHSPVTRERVDKAQALQMVFEDALSHIIDHAIRRTSSRRLVMTGGAALNCVANMNLLRSFGRAYYQRYLGRDTHLHIWVPPIPGDAGAALGATFQFALKNGAPVRHDFTSAYLCGTAPETRDIIRALEASKEMDFAPLADVSDEEGREWVADFMARVISRQGLLGIYQGRAETGPRALGNRSILGNPCSPTTLDSINARVKYRERIRPLAPMVTLEAAKHLFDLDEGASADDYTAYDYMVLTARAKPLASQVIPAVVHHDGTSRIQIVRPSTNPLMYAYLRAMGRHCGVEASVNTSLNVGTPIVQTPAQALEALSRAKAMDGLIMVGADGQVFAVWKRAAAYQSRIPELMHAHLPRPQEAARG